MKCYFKSSSDSEPICYASKSAREFGFDDSAGICFSCAAGCDYCKKTTNGSVCQKYSAKYAPKMDSTEKVIESCLSCSLANCDHCQVVGNKVECRRSACASKLLGTNRNFSFTSKDCAGSCPPNGECANGMVIDENDICYCRNCPAGSVVILSGANAGMCKGCGADCEVCELNSSKDDVECKTCKAGKQWVSVETGSPAVVVKGCYGK